MCGVQFSARLEQYCNMPAPYRSSSRSSFVIYKRSTPGTCGTCYRPRVRERFLSSICNSCRSALKIGEPKQLRGLGSCMILPGMILSYTWIPSPARAHEKKSDPGITFSSICVSTHTHFPKNNTASVVNTKKHYAQEKEETQSFTMVPVSLDNFNGARRTVCFKITT